MRMPSESPRGFLRQGRDSSQARPESRRQIRRRRTKLRNRRIKAVLAGGLVFGIGATATVASWTDTEVADGSFEAGTFNIELSVDGQWSNTREMKFQATSMFPGSKVYAPVFVRTTPGTTMDGALSVSGEGIGGSPTGIGQSLTYRAVTRSIATTDGFTCNADSFNASDPFVFGTASARIPLRDPATGKATSGKPQEIKAAGGSVQAYCFEVLLPENTPNSAQGTEADHTWTFDAESIAPGA